jgi:hypothetical protein
MEKYQADYVQRYNDTHRDVSFLPGDLVWMQHMHRANKMAPKWLGPYRVHARVSNTDYLIHNLKGVPHPHPMNVQHLKRVVLLPSDRSEQSVETGQPVFDPGVFRPLKPLDDNSIFGGGHSAVLDLFPGPLSLSDAVSGSV